MRPSVSCASEACLTAIGPDRSCAECRTACPADSIEVGAFGVRVRTGCFGCGRCAEACPTGALAVDGFELSMTLFPQSTPLTLDCERVPEERHAALRVPCLGGVGAEDLLALRLAVGDRPIRLMDRGWCADCPAHRAAGHVADGQVMRLAELFGEMGLGHLCPEVAPAPLPKDQAIAPAPQRTVTRRALFTRLSDRRAPPAAHHVMSKRRRLLSLVADLARLRRRPMPASLFPALAVGDACRDHRVCTVVCPTSALRGYADATVRGLDFVSGDCLGCGLCVAACSEQAISLVNRAIQPDVGTERLSAHSTRICPRCEDEFVGPGPLCPTCGKSQTFFTTGWMANRLSGDGKKGESHHDSL